MVVLISLLTVIATFLGGSFALKYKDKLHLILGFSAGAVIAVALFDLLPEAISLGSGFGTLNVMIVVALGLVVFMIMDRFLLIHFHAEDGKDSHNYKGNLGAITLSIHSFLDGAAIGLAFKVSPAIGAVVTAAVLAHDFSDGINTVNVVLKNNGSGKSAYKWLIVDALAPALGAASTLFFTLPSQQLGLVLALFSGFFLYLGASDLLPESHHNHPTYWTTFSTFLGMTVVLAAIHLASF